MHDVVLHDELNDAVRIAVSRIEVDDVAKAFVSSLRPRTYAHWSSLASFAFASGLPAHVFAPALKGRACGICGAYLRLDAFPYDGFRSERSCGTIRLDSLRYTLYDLETFAAERVREPSTTDRAFFDAALSRIVDLRSHATTFAAEAALATHFSSRIERKLFLGVLGVCGVLTSPKFPGFRPAFVPYELHASLDPAPYTYPVRWWERRFGVDDRALEAVGLERYLSTATIERIATTFSTP